MPNGSMLHIPSTNLLLLAAKQEPYKRAYLLTKNIKNFLEKKFRRKGQQAERVTVTGLGRKTREKTAQWNQMIALRFQTGGRHQIFPAFLRVNLGSIHPQHNLKDSGTV